MSTNSKQGRKLGRKGQAGFSLIELVVVIVIIAIIGAIAIPKMSRGSAGAGDSALTQDLSVMRSAIDLFNAEHPSFTLTSTNIVSELTEYSDVNGANLSATKTATSIYGPYLRGSALPALPAGVTNKGQTAITTTAPGATATASSGWYYDGTTFWANCPNSEADASGKAYNTY
jgi:prepilin-type N-terminal cleavage/methylation domain-containing protein